MQFLTTYIAHIIVAVFLAGFLAAAMIDWLAQKTNRSNRINPIPDPVPPSGPPMTADQFIRKFRRNYVAYPCLIEAAYGLGSEMFSEYERLSKDDMRSVIEYAKHHVQNA